MSVCQLAVMDLVLIINNAASLTVFLDVLAWMVTLLI